MVATPCGFDPRHRHQKRPLVADAIRGLLYTSLLREVSQDGIGGSYLGAVVQVGIDIAGGADVAVTQPLLDVLERHAVGVEQAGAAVAQIVESDAPETVCFQESRKCLGQVSRPDTLTQGIDIDIVLIVLAIPM